MTIKQIAALKAEIAELDLQIHVLGTQRNQKRQELAVLLCPFKVGNILVSKRGQRAQIMTISPSYLSGGYRMVGTYFKKDGTLGIRTGELWSSGWRKE